MFVRTFISRSSRILLSGRSLIAKPATGTRWWSVLSATTRTVSQKPFVGGVCACSKICACGAHKITQGDKDLLGFLSDEIKFEKDSSKAAPPLDGFSATHDGTVVTLEREINGEKIVVTFDVNQNINEDEAYISGEESEDEKSGSLDDSAQAGNIVSYPYFTVDITKSNGKTLRFTCEYNQGVMTKTDNAVDDDDELFQVVNVSVMSSLDAADSKGLYAAETENLDPNLYTMLLNMLAERGVDSGFTQQLLEYSTALEHHYYIKFLEDLENFIKQK